MEDQVPSFLSWLGVIGGVWVLFDAAENAIAPDLKKKLAAWLRNTNPSGVARWPSHFASVFDSIFGQKHWTRRCFGRSSIASFAAVLIVILIWGALRPGQFWAFLYGDLYIEQILGGLAFFGILNLIPDYISLLESRLVIHLMGDRPSFTAMGVLLCVDLIITVMIAFFAWSVFSVPIVGIETSWHLFRNYVLTLSADIPGGGAYGVFFYSTFFTSAWVWLFALSGLLMKLGTYLGIGLRRFKNVLDVENKPLHSMGLVSIVIITVGYVLVLLRGL